MSAEEEWALGDEIARLWFSFKCEEYDRLCEQIPGAVRTRRHVPLSTEGSEWYLPETVSIFDAEAMEAKAKAVADRSVAHWRIDLPEEWAAYRNKASAAKRRANARKRNGRI
jgi:hypothetical protein